MNRRDLLKTLAGVGVYTTVVSSSTPPRKYGRLTVDTHYAHRQLTGEVLHVFVFGIDVTRSCFEADDVRGYADVFCRDQDHHMSITAQGSHHIGSAGSACRRRVTGDVVITPGAPLR